MSSSILRHLLLLACLCFLVPSSQAEDDEVDASVHDHEHRKYMVCHNILYKAIDFTFDLYQEPASWSKTTNVLLSPMSIVAAFAMISLGTKGDTHTEILKGLKFNLREMPETHIHHCFQLLLHLLQHPDQQLQLTISSSLFVSDHLMLMSKSVQDVKELYHSGVNSINFRDIQFTSKQINNYVERETHGEIVDLVKDLEEDTDLMLVNYISLHGKWTVEFQVEYTVEEDFYVDEVTSIRVPMIHRLGIFLLNRDEELSSWVLVQQSVGDTMAFFFLPDPGKMQQLEEGLTQEHFDNILRTTEKRFARIHFPRLSISATYDLRSILSAMGITKIFSDEADLSAMTEVSSIKLSTGGKHQPSALPGESGESHRAVTASVPPWPIKKVLIWPCLHVTH
ncbi:alpha-1-antitrypsin isoform X1 [Fukomys damarensis]|uniref:alpha-1-antitrypsin isoform X1 n=1 Tax=Fukomys damarensis TaxID=885580 RepID=UPI0014552D24|nr:alpha-1-antitrypsin isoform X1 [Fukomys damarensis]